MQISYENLSTAEIRPDPEEVLQEHILHAGIRHATDQGCYNVDLIVAPDTVVKDKALAAVIRDLGFTHAGTLTEGSPVQQTMLRYRKNIRRSGDGNASDAVYNNTTLAPTPLEAESVELMKRRMSEPLSESRLAALAAMGKQLEGEVKDDPVIAKMKADIARMESEQSAGE